MGWSFFLDLDLRVPSNDFAALTRQTAGEHPTAASWWGLKQAGLAESFSGPDFDDWSFEKLLASQRTRRDAHATVSSDDGHRAVRVVTSISDDSDMSIARAFAAMFEGSRAIGGHGTLTLVNDGTFGGEGGVVLTLKGGAISRKRITDCWPYSEKLGRLVFGNLVFDDEDVTQPAAPKKAASKKAASKKAVPKKVASKKAAPKKVSSKKTTAKKAKKPATKKAGTKSK